MRIKRLSIAAQVFLAALCLGGLFLLFFSYLHTTITLQKEVGRIDFLFMMLFVVLFSLGLFFSIRKMVTERLRPLIDYTGNLRRDQPTFPEVPKSKKRMIRVFDEIDELGVAMTAMHDGLVKNLVREKREESLQTRERTLLEALINSIPDLIFYKDIDGVYLGCNTAFEKFSGWKMGELVGRTDHDIFPVNLAEFFRSKDREMFIQGGPKINEEWVTYPDGHEVLLETMKTIYRDEKGSVLGLIGISRDVTGRKMAENELKVMQERFEAAFNASPMMIMILDADSDKIIDVNLCCLQKTGYAKENILNRPLSELGILSDPEIRRSVVKKIEKDTTFEEFPIRVRKQSGEELDCLLAGRKVTFAGSPSMLIFFEDITLRKQAEEAMRRSMKMDAIGKVTGGIAHDFNNILGIIIGNLDFIKRFGAPGDLILKRVEAAAKASERAAMLTRQLLDFSGKQAKNHQPTDINRIIRGMDNLIAGSVTPEVEVVVDLTPDPWIVDIDRGDFENVLLNLVINARDAMPEGGKLQISTSNMVLDEYFTLMNPGLAPGEYILLAVRDDGVGIPPKSLDRIFEPFYTTKPQGKGTGLGMSMVYTFCQRSKGSARVYSEVGVGTTVHVYLPRIKELEGEKTNLLRLGILPGLPGGNETILIVEDEKELLALADDVLRILGYTTLAANNGNEAMNQILDKRNTIDMLFTDVVMPGGINGFDLAEQALLVNPDLKTLFTTGNIKKAMPKAGQFPFEPRIVMKPYREIDLAICIREVLDGD